MKYKSPRQRLPPWYVILKVCLPSTIGLIKEPELLENVYSKKAEEEHQRVSQSSPLAFSWNLTYHM